MSELKESMEVDAAFSSKVYLMFSPSEKYALKIVGRLSLAAFLAWLSFVMVISLQLKDYSLELDEVGALMRFAQKWGPVFWIPYAIGLLIWVVKDFAKKPIMHLLVIWLPFLLLCFFLMLLFYGIGSDWKGAGDVHTLLFCLRRKVRIICRCD